MSPFEKGHPPYYTGGSVPGHAPTNPNAPGMSPDHPNWKLGEYAFGTTAKGEENRKKGQGRPKDKERRCLEEIQAGQERDQILERRYPPRMIKRIRALLEVSEDPTHRDWMNAVREVSKILGRNRGTSDENAEAKEPDRIEVTFGRLDIPMPGAGKDPPKDGGGPG